MQNSGLINKKNTWDFCNIVMAEKNEMNIIWPGFNYTVNSLLSLLHTEGTALVKQSFN